MQNIPKRDPNQRGIALYGVDGDGKLVPRVAAGCAPGNNGGGAPFIAVGCNQDMLGWAAAAVMLGESPAVIFWDPNVMNVRVLKGGRHVEMVSYRLLVNALDLDTLSSSLGESQAIMNSGAPTDTYLPPINVAAYGGWRRINFIDLEFVRNNIGLNQELTVDVTGIGEDLQPLLISQLNVKFTGNCVSGNVYVFPCNGTQPSASGQSGDNTLPRSMIAMNTYLGVGAATRAIVTAFGTPAGAAADAFTLTRRFFDTSRREHASFYKMLGSAAQAEVLQ
jgi:hypothetical protein